MRCHWEPVNDSLVMLSEVTEGRETLLELPRTYHSPLPRCIVGSHSLVQDNALCGWISLTAANSSPRCAIPAHSGCESASLSSCCPFGRHPGSQDNARDVRYYVSRDRELMRCRCGDNPLAVHRYPARSHSGPLGHILNKHLFPLLNHSWPGANSLCGDNNFPSYAVQCHVRPPVDALS